MVFENIRNLREDNDKTQQEIADYLNIKQTTYSKYELGKINIPIETFLFIDKNEQIQEKLSIIEEIMQYNISLFNYNRKKERLIYCIKESYEKIKRGVYVNGKEIKLTPVRAIL